MPFYSSVFSPLASTAHTDTYPGGLSGVLLSFAGVAVFILLAAYWLSSCSAMWTLIYLGARYNRDKEDLLLRAEEEEYREFNKVYNPSSEAGDKTK